MELNANVLKSFVNKATVDCQMNNFLLIAKDKKLYAISKDLTNVLLTSVSLNIDSTEEFRLPIKDSRVFKQALGLFDDKVQLIKDGNVLSIFNKSKQVDILLAEESFIECFMESVPEKLQWENLLTIDQKTLSNILKNSTVSKTPNTSFELSKTNLTIISGDKNSDKVKETLGVNSSSEAKVTIGALLLDVLKVVDLPNIQFGLKDGYPLKIVEKNDSLEALYIIALRVSTDE